MERRSLHPTESPADQEDTSRCLLTVFRTRGIQRRGDGKDVPRNLFPRLGAGWLFAPGDAWNLPSEGTGVGVRLVSPAEGAGALGTSPFW